MAHITTIRGEVSELTASCLLMTELGWEVSRPLVPETYDLLGRDPNTGKYYRVQVKTVRRRHDRENQPVVYATNSKGEAYMPDDVDYILGVEGAIAYLFNCRGKKEYWLNEENTDASATKYMLLGA
ncbi:hypothetical protein HCB26_06175 [Listeria booriae]|uniref:PD(D/E)XK endonuclease domain-containing protein n=1 Tax=Listeria booriae TaxID=1552123 RepID=A0A7X0YYX2_9LIST|nr:hypothetical protein [Listeria booriae]MBC1290544.1 hypothetical protein [Listeria booriae]MBC1564091.1 hypothetical protein [Listeria booriae]MBC2166152.1 hypothetical protein [Listeria booriae]